MQKPLVLHITESLGGGVTVAIADYIASTKGEYDHIVLGHSDVDFDPGSMRGADVLPMSAVHRPGQVRRQILNALARYQPDIVHLHSSWAGAVGRLFVPDKHRIVYTPHCFAMERTDVSRIAISAYRFVERALARRMAGVIAVSTREAAIAQRLSPRVRARVVPNIAEVPPDLSAGPRHHEGPLRVVSGGRLCPQKDPMWFAEVAKAAGASQIQARFEWLGGGDPAEVTRLSLSGIHVTGWQEREPLLRALAGADCYVHTAAWEGAPLMLLEAAALGVPVVARAIPALAHLAPALLANSPAEAASKVKSFAKADNWEAAHKAALSLSVFHSRPRQASALSECYASVLDRNFGAN